MVLQCRNVYYHYILIVLEAKNYTTLSEKNQENFRLWRNLSEEEKECYNVKAREAARDDEQEQLVSNSEFTAKAIVKLHEHVSS